MLTNMTSKGQVTIPKRVRDAAGLKPGKPVDIEFSDGAATVRPARKPAKSDFEKRVEKARAKFNLGMTTDEYLDLIRNRRD